MRNEVKETVLPLPNNWVGKNRYKTGGLTVLTCLAVWSLLSGGAGLAIRMSVGIYPFSGKLPESGADSLASLLMNEVEDRSGVTAYEIRQSPLAGWELAERAKIVLWAWETYMNDPGKTLGRFWHNCFEAAFEELASEDQAVKKAALEEIAKLTVNVFDVDEDFEKLNPRLLVADVDPMSGKPGLWKR